MADIYKGLTIQFGAETKGLSAALRDIGKESRGIGAELRKVENALKFNPGNTELLRQKQELLGKQIENTRTRLESLKLSQSKIDAMYQSGEIDDGAYRAFQRDLIETGSKLDNLERKASGANEQLEVKPKVHQSYEKLGTVAKTAAKTVAGATALAGAAFIGMTAKVIENADELQRQSDVTGLSAERLGELQYIGSNLGVELDTIAGAQAKLTRSMASAEKGTGKQADAFKALGVKVTDSEGNLRDANTVMLEAFDALGKMKNETERNALAQQIFGKSAADLNPLIAAGADEVARLGQEARDSGAVMSNEAVAGLDSFGDTLDNLKASLMGWFGENFGQQFSDAATWITDKLSPAISTFTTDLQKSGDPLGSFQTLLKSAFGSGIPPEFFQQLRGLQTAVQGYIDELRPNIEKIAGFFRDMVEDIRPHLEAFAKEVVPTITAMVDHMKAVMKTLAPVVIPIWKGIAAVIGAVLKTIIAVIRTAMAIIRGDWKGAFSILKEFAVDALTNAADFIRRTLDKIKGFFSRLTLKLPDIKLPHFKLTGSFSLKPPKVPKLSVDWYNTGGSFAPNTPSLVGVGDQRSGFEHVLRDDQIVSLMQRALGGGQRPIQININQPAQSYSEIRRAVRDAAEELAW